MRDTDVQREINRMSRKQDDDDIQDYVRPWRGLTDEDIGMCLDAGDGSMSKIISFIEAKLKEKNHG
jgi:hypothetical protein